MGIFSLFAATSTRSTLSEGLSWLVLGSLMEVGRRLFMWIIDRIKFRFYVTAQFRSDNPPGDWIFLYLLQEKIWQPAPQFAIRPKSGARKWGADVTSKEGGMQKDEGVEYVPMYSSPHLFKWRGYWFEIRETEENVGGPWHSVSESRLHLTVYTLDVSVIAAFINEAKARYEQTYGEEVVLHSSTTEGYGGDFLWNHTVSRQRRPLSSLALQPGAAEALLADAQEFLDTEKWYKSMGIPHRRGYLLHGPPGTGKTSTIYALAGELHLEVFVLSLSGPKVDDAYLRRAAASIPPRSILLIEDIDCAFSNREDVHSGPDNDGRPAISGSDGSGSKVTLSSLLNVLDGVNSENGRIFFATTNHPERLDPALLRPGRIDMKIEYKLATKEQACSLFQRFFAGKQVLEDGDNEKQSSPKDNEERVLELAQSFADGIEDGEFSTAELQGYLLGLKRDPVAAASGVRAWVELRRDERRQEEGRDPELRLGVWGSRKLRATKGRSDVWQSDIQACSIRSPSSLESSACCSPIDPVFDSELVYKRPQAEERAESALATPPQQADTPLQE
ncbi:hypothetical protein JAAARDRAFT_126837 [Jaapia argillacea MUCL 33604]|uniref:AAA+ ATPase domain-containing protein n=1 Tax=Jaapia argillacea MUCL 33604 TaxID=933084 RepID=A0A067Q0K7_9AGAM|nr:hypothetical protein JAAARDRAFT_126837 [Jaapia argillacea MUCL 33604]